MIEDVVHRGGVETRLLRLVDPERNPATLAALRRMPAAELAEAAIAAGVDLEQERRERERPSARGVFEEVFDSEEERLRYDHSVLNPGFEGRIEFDYVVEAFGRAVRRTLRIDYRHTPAWAYFDLEKDGPFRGWPLSRWEVFARVPPGVSGLGGPTRERTLGEDAAEWRALWADEIGVLFGEIEDEIHAEIERRCREEDTERRRGRSDEAPV